MKSFKLPLYLAFLSLSAVFLFSCGESSGLGEEVDLEPPVISVTQLNCEGLSEPVTSFGGGVYCKKSFTFSGTATDNKSVTAVSSYIKWAGEESFSELKNASLSGNKWTLDVSLESEGVAFIKITAEDSAKNTASKSSKVITLFVDESAPSASAWYIDRKLSGVTYGLKDLETLENLDLTEFSNVDASQNVSFDIRSNFKDTMGIKANSVSIKILDEDEKEVCTIQNSGTSDYAPEFSITHEALVYGASALSTGKHYLHIVYSAEDVVSVPESNSAVDVEIDGGYFIWWPESDYPKISSALIETDSSASEIINLNVSDALTVDFFDDDALDEIYCAFLTEEDYKAFSASHTVADLEEDPTILSGYTNYESYKTSDDGERDHSFNFKAESTPQAMHLLAYVSDKTEAKNVTIKDIPVYVVDQSAPILLITSPANNTIPAVTMASDNSSATVTISGEALDSVGCTYLEFVWVPDTIAASGKTSIAQELLSTITSDSDHKALLSASPKTYDSGLKIWAVSLGEASLYESSGLYKQDFSFDVDLFNDFICSGTNEKACDKSFVAKLTRKDGNVTYAEYKLLADTDLPTIVPLAPVANWQIVSSASDFTLEFYGKKDSGLSMDSSSYKIELVGYSISGDNPVTLANGYSELSGELKTGLLASNVDTYQCTLSAKFLENCNNAGIKPKFRFTVADLFGNKTSEQYTINITNLPVLNSISSTSSTLCKLGDEIIINASFSNTVYVDSSISGEALPYIKLKGISNSLTGVTTETVVPAYYKSGSGGTTLQFSYTVQEGDVSSGLLVYNESGKGPININRSTSTLSESSAILTSLSDSNNLQAKKTIQIDGIVPTASSPEITTTAASSSNVNPGITYLREGRKLTVTVNASETIYIQGSPTFDFSVTKADGTTGTLSLPFTSCSTTTITFSKKIASDDANGALTYTPSSCITGYDTITDAAGNALSLKALSSAEADAKIIIDTKAPEKPTIKDSSGTSLVSGKYTAADGITFTISTSDSDISSTEYSLDGGSSWSEYSSDTKLTSSAQLTARSTDWAGNVSDYADVIDLDLGTFPSFTLECTNADGNYKAGKILTLKVTFASKVNVAANAGAKIKLSGQNTTDSVGNGSNKGYAYLSSSEKQDSVTSVFFTYEIEDPDEFTLKVEKGNVTLTGITDLYGNSQTTETLSEDYTRNIKCDGVAPKVVSMTPGGTKTTSGSINVYTKGNEITLVFSEEIQKSSGNITLRQVAGWAIPPVISGDDFDTILNALSSDTDKEYLAIGSSSSSYLEDMEDVEKGIHYANDNYHGTGQYVGPYKKSSQGLAASSGQFIPDTSTKFVLDFDMGIWETTTEHYFGTTFKSGYATTNNTSDKSRLKVLSGSSKENLAKITVNNIRSALENAGYHERVLDVTSSNVVIGSDNKTVKITFPAGLCDTSDALPYGRKWELVIEKGSFMDSTGNEFGAESNGVLAEADAVQKSGSQYTVGTSVSYDYSKYTGSWARAQSSNTSPVVLICNDSNEYFWSDKVATPVVRVDRYSYGLGIYQATSEGGQSAYISDDNVPPAGYVRVRIDCETEGATLKYGTKLNTTTAITSASGTATQTDTSTGDYCYSYITATDFPSSLATSVSASTSYTTDSSFAVGNGSYSQSFKAFVIANGTLSGLTDSSSGYEGVFQTVARIYKHTQGNGTRPTATIDKGAGYRDFSIRGTTGWGGEPSITPFPLRDSRNGSPYLRRCFSEYDYNTSSYDYYWVSYEVLVGSSVSGYSYGNTGGTYWGYNWSKNWGYLEPGESSFISGMRCWESY
ncbi:MAG: hypothetical protein IJ630_07310 [Treponema sp.]|nr:hypothetical protein [Treponema sp.]